MKKPTLCYTVDEQHRCFSRFPMCELITGATVEEGRVSPAKIRLQSSTLKRGQPLLLDLRVRTPAVRQTFLAL